MRNILFIIILTLGLPLFIHAQNESVSLTIHLRGVNQSKISLLALNKSNLFKPVYETPIIKNGESTTIKIDPTYLPGEFVLRFDYYETEKSTPYPSEKSLIISTQNLELWVSPKYCNNSDSTFYQPDEKENKALSVFMAENQKQKSQLGLLQSLLMNYNETETDFYKAVVKEYEQKRKNYNNWIDDCSKKDKKLFVSNLYRFDYLPAIPFKGSETERINNLIAHYFDGIDFDNHLMIKLPKFFEYMNNYINLNGQLCTTVALRDSLIPQAARIAIERAQKGHPLVYGWMVDYFYRGFESNAIDAGMKILKPFIDDPNCMTSKRIEIQRRLEGMKTLVIGSKAPDIEMYDSENNSFKLYEINTERKYILVVFWSADCSHCVETLNGVYPWYNQPEIQQQLQVIAISLDETEPEIAKWKLKTPELNNWKHLRAVDGIRSKAASDYFVLATPVMVLIDAKTKNIVAMPNTAAELKKALEHSGK
jgi:thioredoxin-related protein